MKKAKIFLSAIAVFAVVGGALAFKAKTFGQAFCTRIEDNAGVCDAAYQGKIDPNQVNAFFYTPTVDVDACGEVDCTSTTFLTDKE
jgi:hypothetical protein